MRQDEHPADNSWWGAILTLLVTLGITIAIFGLWYQDRNADRQPIESFLPSSSGVTLNYRVTGPGATDSYHMSNLGRLQGLNALNEIPVDAQSEVVAPLLGLEPDALKAENYGKFLRNQSQQLVAVRSLETSLGANSAITTTKQIILLQPYALNLFSINSSFFSPSVPLLDLNMNPGASKVVTGTVGLSSYESRLTYEAREAIDTPIGKQQDCHRVRLFLVIDETQNDLRSWYCAGVGLARQEVLKDEQQQELYELIGINSASQRSFVQQAPISMAETVAQRGDQGRGFYEDRVGGELDWTWSYREKSGLNQAITTPATISEDLVYVGTASGLTLALDRTSHQLRWRFQTGDAVVAAPTLAAGTLYVSSTDRKLYALDARTGFLRWVFGTRDSLSGAAAVSNGMVYIGSEDRSLYALDAANGQERWRFSASDAITATPSISDGTLYIGADDGALYALDAGSGAVRWAFATESAITAPAIVVDGVVYVGSHDGNLYALKAQSTNREGELLWSFNTYAAISDAMILHNGLLYVQNDASVIHAIDLNGAQRWRYDHELTLYGPPLLLGTQLLLHGRDNLVVLNPENGSVQRRIPTATNGYSPISSDGRELFIGHRGGFITAFGDGSKLPWRSTPLWQATGLSDTLFSAEDLLLTAPIVDNQNLIILSSGGRIFRVARSDGQATQIAKVDGLGNAMLPPTLSGLTLLLGDQFGNLVAVDLQAGAERWRTTVPGRTFSPAAVADDQVLLSSTDPQTKESIVTAFNISDGSQRWQKRFPFPLSVGSSALLHNGHYYIVANQLQALESASGETLWSQSTTLFSPYQIAALDDSIYAIGFDANFNPAIAAFDASTGKQRYVKRVETASFPMLHGGISVADKAIVLSMNDNSVIVLDATTGTQRWQALETAAHTGPAIVVGDSLVRVSLDNRLIARQLSDGSLIADFTLQEASSVALESVMQPVVVDQTLYTALYQHVFALELKQDK